MDSSEMKAFKAIGSTDRSIERYFRDVAGLAGLLKNASSIHDQAVLRGIRYAADEARLEDGGQDRGVGEQHGGPYAALQPPLQPPFACRQVGEIRIKGPNVVKGYHNRPDENAKAFVDGFLLTGDERYLEPYNRAVTEIDQLLEVLADAWETGTPEAAATSQLARDVQRKLAEMDLSVRMRKNRNDNAWKFVLMTDVGKEHMDAIRAQAPLLESLATLEGLEAHARAVRARR